jgi:hypothetical protein
MPLLLLPVVPIIVTMNLPEWAEHHHHQGHHLHPAPTAENPTRWNCDCGGVWRILKLQQVEKKFAHLKRDMTYSEQARLRDTKCTTGLEFVGHDAGLARRLVRLPRA